MTAFPPHLTEPSPRATEWLKVHYGIHLMLSPVKISAIDYKEHSHTKRWYRILY